MLETPLFDQGPARTDAATAPLPRAVDLGEFVVGNENRLVAAAVAELLEAPTMGPLVLHGPSGSGKTLVVREIVGAWSIARPDDVVMRLTGGEFAEQYAAAVETDRIDSLRRRFAECDLLIVDGLQSLQGKASAQQELLHVCDALEGRGTVIVALDVAPNRSDSLMPSLTARLAGGIVVGLAAPSVESRRTILRRLAERTGGIVDDDALQPLAADRALGIPEMTGAFLTLRQSAVVDNRKFDGHYVREALERRAEASAPTLKQVTEATARRFELSVADLKSHSRRRTVVAARDVAMLLARRVGGSTLQEIGRYFGGRDHTTVLHSCRKLEAALLHDSELRTTFDEIRRAVCC